MSCLSLLFVSLILILKCGADEMEYHGEWAHLFTAEERAIIASKPIRREMRYLETEEWQRIVDAMWIMKTTPQDEGEAKYGPKYASYDQIICQHMLTDTPDGDIGHYVSAFFTFHRAIERRMEQSLQAIDSSIEAAPYWDYRLDAYNDISESIIFSDAYMGSVPGNPNDGYMVTDGKFAYWPISRNENFEICSGLVSKSPYGYMRTQWFVLSQPYLVRHGNKSCVGHESFDDAVTDWPLCLEVEQDITTMESCMNDNVHSCAHSNIGGLGYAFENQIDDSSCTDYYTFCDEHKTCMKCPECEYGVDETTDCWCTIDADNPDCNYNMSDYDMSVQQISGDFRDLASSPNEPMFLFHHINMDRYFMIWQVMNWQYRDEYWNFPTSNGTYGTDLDDICGWEYPFMNIWDNDNKPYTNRDILDKSTLLLNSYTYQTIIDMITPVDVDSSDDSGETIIAAAVDNDFVDDAVVFDFSYYLGSISATLWYAIAGLSMAAMICGASVVVWRRRESDPLLKSINNQTLYSTF